MFHSKFLDAAFGMVKMKRVEGWSDLGFSLCPLSLISLSGFIERGIGIDISKK